MNIKTKHTNNPLTFGLAMTAGIGLVLMIVALGIGVIGQPDANAIGVLFALGLVLFLLGVGAWVGVTKPYQHFDDINQPKDSGHGHGHGAHDASHAITVTDPNAAAVEPAHPAAH
jgi:amino acid transporter